MSENFPNVSPYQWTPKKQQAAVLLAEGFTHQKVAERVGVTKRTITNWLGEMEFRKEVDTLSVMVSIAGRAERLRMAMRAFRQFVKDDGTITTERDALDWLKFARDETDGIKTGLDAAFANALASFTGSGQDRLREPDGGDSPGT